MIDKQKEKFNKNIEEYCIPGKILSKAMYEYGRLLQKKRKNLNLIRDGEIKISSPMSMDAKNVFRLVAPYFQNRSTKAFDIFMDRTLLTYLNNRAVK